MSEVTDEEIKKARQQMAEKFGNTQIGGKGTQKRKKEAKHRGNKVEADKKIQALAKKSGARKINEVNEINIFKDDNSVIHLKKPTLEYSFKEKVSFVSGAHETKTIKDLLPGILKQLGPKQYEFVKDIANTIKKQKKTDKTEEAPELVEDFEEVAKEKKEEKKEEEKKVEEKKEEIKKEEIKKEETKKQEVKKQETKKEEKKEALKVKLMILGIFVQNHK